MATPRILLALLRRCPHVAREVPVAVAVPLASLATAVPAHNAAVSDALAAVLLAQRGSVGGKTFASLRIVLGASGPVAGARAALLCRALHGAFRRGRGVMRDDGGRRRNDAAAWAVIASAVASSLTTTWAVRDVAAVARVALSHVFAAAAVELEGRGASDVRGVAAATVLSQALLQYCTAHAEAAASHTAALTTGRPPGPGDLPALIDTVSRIAAATRREVRLQSVHDAAVEAMCAVTAPVAEGAVAWEVGDALRVARALHYGHFASLAVFEALRPSLAALDFARLSGTDAEDVVACTLYCTEVVQNAQRPLPAEIDASLARGFAFLAQRGPEELTLHKVAVVLAALSTLQRAVHGPGPSPAVAPEIAAALLLFTERALSDEVGRKRHAPQSPLVLAQLVKGIAAASRGAGAGTVSAGLHDSLVKVCVGRVAADPVGGQRLERLVLLVARLGATDEAKGAAQLRVLEASLNTHPRAVTRGLLMALGPLVSAEARAAVVALALRWRGDLVGPKVGARDAAVWVRTLSVALAPQTLVSDAAAGREDATPFPEADAVVALLVDYAEGRSAARAPLAVQGVALLALRRLVTRATRTWAPAAREEAHARLVAPYLQRFTSVRFWAYEAGGAQTAVAAALAMPLRDPVPGEQPLWAQFVAAAVGPPTASMVEAAERLMSGDTHTTAVVPQFDDATLLF